MNQITARFRPFRLAMVALVAAFAVYFAPLGVQSAFATEDPGTNKCSVSCSRGSCEATGTCTCTCSFWTGSPVCSCGDSGGGGGGSDGGEQMT